MERDKNTSEIGKYKIAFISPIRELEASFWLNRILSRFSPHNMIPLALINLASLTPKEFIFKLFAISPDKLKKFKFQPDLVCISSTTWNACAAYKIAKFFKDKKIPVIMGGVHPSMLPKEALEFCNSVAIGDTEEIWSDILDDFKNCRLKKTYKKKISSNEIHLPKRRTLVEKEWNNNIIESTRGCPMNCDFCSVTTLHGSKLRHRPIEELVEEIKFLKRKSFSGNVFYFVDDNIIVDKFYAKKLFRALKPLNIRWFSQSDLSIAKDDELLDLAYESGCRVLAFGFESVNQKMLDSINKKFCVDEYEALIKKLQKKGILVGGSFIFGLEGEDKDVFDKTANFCKRTDLDLLAFGILTPFPGTITTKRLEEQKRILHKNWEKYDDFHLVFRSKIYKPGEAEKKIYKIYKEFCSLPKIVAKIIKIAWRYKFRFRKIFFFTLAYIHRYHYDYLRMKYVYKKEGIL